MPDRLAFSKQHPDLQHLARCYDDAEKSLRLYFSPAAPSFAARFANYKPDQVDSELSDRLAELEMATAFSIFSAIEAAFRIDYLQRFEHKILRSVWREATFSPAASMARASDEESGATGVLFRPRISFCERFIRSA